jgi:TolB protein
MASGMTGKIVFSSGKHTDYDIWTLDFETRELNQLTHGKQWNDKPRWSPDGRSVVFVSDVAGTPDIYRVSADGEGPATPLIRDGFWNDFPAFSPDGRKLGYVSNASGNNDIWVADADGSNPRRLTNHPGDDTFFAWAPDGQSILFSSDREGNADIFRLDIKTGRKHQLTVDAGMDIHPAPSPDGRWIAFVSNRQFAPHKSKDEWSDRDLDVWMMRADGADQVRITDNQGSDRCVTWSPDGRHLIYAATGASNAAERLRIVDVSDLTKAYETSNGEFGPIHRAADRLREESVKFDRGRLEHDIEAVRRTFFFTAMLPDAIMKKVYGNAYWGHERFPDWHAGSKPATPVGSAWEREHHYA